MILWVRSQNGRELRPQPKLGIDKIKDLYYIVDRYDFERVCVLGMYGVEERALEILDDIQDLLANAYTGNANSIIYQMPKE